MYNFRNMDVPKYAQFRNIGVPKYECTIFETLV